MNSDMKWALGCSFVVIMWILTVFLLIIPYRDFDLLDLFATWCAGFLSFGALLFFLLSLSKEEGEKK